MARDDELVQKAEVYLLVKVAGQVDVEALDALFMSEPTTNARELQRRAQEYLAEQFIDFGTDVETAVTDVFRAWVGDVYLEEFNVLTGYPKARTFVRKPPVLEGERVL